MSSPVSNAASSTISGVASSILGGTAGKIDTKSLINSLMEAKKVPQDQLKDSLDHLQKVTQNIQEINRRMQAITDAGREVTDVDFGKATSASSSNSAVEASSSAGATSGSATFHVVQTAAAQVSTVAVDGSGNVVSDPNSGITLTVGGQDHHVDLKSGSASDVASAINKAGIGVHAAVININDPNNPGETTQILQLSSAKTGIDNGFTTDGSQFSSAMNTIVDAQDAEVSVGTVGNGGYTISSSTNTFTDAMPGVTFTVGAGAVDQDATITVGTDSGKAADKVQSLVDALNKAKGGISTITGKGALLEGHTEITSIGMQLANVISSPLAGGGSLTQYGIDMDKNGTVSFDADTFKAAFQADSTGTIDAIKNGLASPLEDVAWSTSAPATGTLGQTVQADQAKQDRLSDEISTWDKRLSKDHDRLVAKYTAMNSALAKLQSQGDWLTSMFDSINGKKDD